MNDETPLFGLRVSAEGGWWTVHLIGQLDLAQAPMVLDVADAVRQCQLAGVDLDLRGVTFIDSAGYRAVLDAATIIKSGGAQVRILDESSAVHRLVALWELVAA